MRKYRKKNRKEEKKIRKYINNSEDFLGKISLEDAILSVGTKEVMGRSYTAFSSASSFWKGVWSGFVSRVSGVPRDITRFFLDYAATSDYKIRTCKGKNHI